MILGGFYRENYICILEDTRAIQSLQDTDSCGSSFIIGWSVALSKIQAALKTPTTQCILGAAHSFDNAIVGWSYWQL